MVIMSHKVLLLCEHKPNTQDTRVETSRGWETSGYEAISKLQILRMEVNLPIMS